MTDAALADRQELLHLLGRHWNPPAATMLAAVDRQVESYAEGAEVVAEDGSRTLDLAGSYGVFLVGHGNPAVRAAVRETLTTNPGYVGGTRHPAVERLVEALRTVVPAELGHLSFGSSGAHVAELALRTVLMARPGRSRVVVVGGGYHGKTLGALTLLGGDGHRDPFASRSPEVVMVPPGDADALDRAVRGRQVAAVFAEPVLGGAHLRVPPPGWFAAVAASCRRTGTLLVADEIQTAFGRTGRLLGADHDGVVPDVLLLSKALTGGMVPIAVLAASAEVIDSARRHPASEQLPPLWGEPGSTGGLRSGVAAAAGAAAIEQVHALDLPGRAAELGPVLLDGLRDAARRHPRHLVDAPGIGLMTGLRARNPAVETLISMQMAHRGIHLGHSLNEDIAQPVLRFYPPLTIERKQIEQVLTALEESLSWLDRRPRALTRGITGLLRRQRSLPPGLVMKLNHSPLKVTW
ncbi:aminotransferase class III-fold pyridoxal phosphate-dependent enzyme [Pseudonocardia sp. KRD291]|uniref:aminotransferase class III-fold pyridoxal phosphate-dependent enzyme n=1 Tax=Pseudonocardia sp. KRD291 TaxID=2792007 RepID=UPI001C4A0B33|nr:aminotransferase class III-fold pyridoxal phosphate-dependent enzyme [Pseudonocardia sp. KRD291]MBW0106168.1 aminotransferase class III-fold pyridoxal phosphate-dependent enzyme [Pseudonocardia sp. KRD291]